MAARILVAIGRAFRVEGVEERNARVVPVVVGGRFPVCSARHEHTHDETSDQGSAQHRRKVSRPYRREMHGSCRSGRTIAHHAVTTSGARELALGTREGRGLVSDRPWEGFDGPDETPPAPEPPPPGQPPAGWWLASDGRWYPPEARAAATPPPQPPPYAPQPPPYQQQPYGYPQPAYGSMVHAPTRTTNGLAVASLVLSLLWFCGAGSIAAVVLGFVGKRQVDRSAGAQSGAGLAIAGIVLGVLGLLATVGWVALLASSDGDSMSSTLELEGSFGSADDRAVQSDLRNALSAEKVFFAEEERFTDDPAALADIEPSIEFVRGTFPQPDVVSVAVAEGGSMVCIASRTDDGDTYVIVDTGDATFFGTSPVLSCGPSATLGMSPTADEGWAR